MAKDLASRYCPGKRSSAWRKVKPVAVIPCVVVGYTLGREGVRRLLLATVRDQVFDRHRSQPGLPGQPRLAA